MIYLDTSVVLAQLFAGDRHPPESTWRETLVSSRLLEYELWTRVHACKLARSHGEVVRALLGRVALLELAAPVLVRALEPFPVPVRTLDALHLASAELLRLPEAARAHPPRTAAASRAACSGRVAQASGNARHAA